MATFTYEKFNKAAAQTSSKVAIFIRENAPDRDNIKKYYLDHLGVKEEDVAIGLLPYENGKYRAKLAEQALKGLLQACDNNDVEFIYVLDSNYAKKLLGIATATAKYVGELKETSEKLYPKQFKMMLGINYKAAAYNETIIDKLNYANTQFAEILRTNGLLIKQNPLKTYIKIETKEELMALLAHPKLTVDIEGYSLEFYNAYIATIAFGISADTAYVLYCDLSEMPYEVFGRYHEPIPNKERRQWLKEFFMAYTGKCIYHNATYDVKVLIYNLFMSGLLDQEGLIDGLNCLCSNVHDSKIIAYLALNSTSRIELDLKSLALTFMGQYAEDEIKDISQIPADRLGVYNAKDTIATWFVAEKYYAKVVEDQQIDIYNNLFIPSLKTIIQMELQGMPMDMDRVKYVDKFLQRRLDKYEAYLRNHPLIQDFTLKLRDLEAIKANKKLKKLRKSRDDFPDKQFNPGSPKQVVLLIYETFGYPVTRTTDTGQPSAKADVLKSLLHTATPEHKPIIKALIGIGDIATILSTFIRTFIKKGVLKEDGMYYLHGNFNLGGTVSGRLSSSGPNMQNLPSTGSKYAKLVKSCFAAPPGWILCGADYASLEDRISALTTRDPNKLKVYTDGFDGHCLRAYAYFGTDMPDIIDGDADSINSIEYKYSEERQRSKGPTFALTYQGTWHALVNEIGLSKEDAQNIENKYHELYTVSDQWVQDKLEQACSDGYVTVAFGLRVRTPILAKTMLGTSVTPPAASAEGRTAGNALGQSYGLLNNRASNEFQEILLNSKYRFMIKPLLQVHDSQYFLVKNDIECLTWFNIELIDCMQWQDLPELQHDEVKLGGQVELFHPNWAYALKIPNQSTQKEIRSLVVDYTSKK